MSTSNPTRAFYDRISHVYDLIADAGERRARRLGLELLAARSGETVLEVGFGTGHGLAELARAVGAPGKVVGVDLSSGMVEVAHKRLEREGLLERVELVRAEVPPIPRPDESFDAVFSSFTLELFERERIPEVLAELRRVLRPGGRCGVVSMATVSPGEQESVLERTYKWMHCHFPHIVDCRPIEVEREVAAAGFELIEERRVSLFTMPVAVVVGRRPPPA